MMIFEPQAHLDKRLLINYAVEPEVVQLPAGFRPAVFNGKAMIGICILNLSQMRPFPNAPAIPSFRTWNVAHRVAAIDQDGEPVVFIYKRFTNSRTFSMFGTLFSPGIHEHARFEVTEPMGVLNLRMLGKQEYLHTEVRADQPEWSSQLFGTVEDASAVFQSSPRGFSPVGDGSLEELVMRVTPWSVRPVTLASLSSSFIDQVPSGAVTYDHTLLMQNAEVAWETVSGRQEDEAHEGSPLTPVHVPGVPNPAAG